MRTIALVPARSGSKRVPGKNVRRLGSHPLLAYSVAAALESAVFDDVLVSTDSDEYAAIARHYGADVPFLRPAELAGDASPDIEWVRDALDHLADDGQVYDAFAILRPTSPFRSADTIRRAVEAFLAAPSADSLRAVEPCTQHPGKMWRISGGLLHPVLPVQPGGTPWHSQPTQSLPPVWVQNASLEIAWCRCPLEQGSIAGDVMIAFETTFPEGLDVNDERDWLWAEHLLATGVARLPPVAAEPARSAG